jgi:hypothetical protein
VTIIELAQGGLRFVLPPDTLHLFLRNPMYRTLSQLRNSIDNLIEQQGEDAVCAAFVFTKEDVFYYNNEDGLEILDEQVSLNAEDTDDVLTELGGCDYIYEQVNEIIEDEVKRVRNKVTT